ncbi:FAD-binding oxidoreductase [Bryobacter aggregatus]|uniref:FAD-binding oxidoreductase n=1 Tax=Bryobacter aggregatus TaxID=360054 RepID=UPI0004E2067F|nr:FAD-dependent oxidoreductase [Bryobacter aggregatus]
MHQSPPKSLDLKPFELVLGAANIISAASLSTATFPTAVQIPAVLRPGSVSEVQECLRLAASHDIRLHPISTGMNWGYGSAVPYADSTLLLDLGRMNRILDYDDRLGYVVIEPGVTQQQLYDFLQEKGGRYWMDATGSSPSCSIIGNTLERGFGHTPLSDHFANSCSYQVVLATGEVIETGLGALTGSASRNVFRWGVGPFIDGLFSQSRLGVVTRMTIWLMPAPEAFLPFFFRCGAPDALPPLVETLRDLRMNGILQSAVHIVNDYRVLAGIQQYPWQETHGETPLGPLVLAVLRKRDGFGAWNGSGALYGPKKMVRTMQKLLSRTLRPKVDSLNFASERLLSFAKSHSAILSPFAGMNLDKTLGLIAPSIDLLRGRPSNHALRSIYWRKKRPIPGLPDPNSDRCGLLWSAPVCSADGESAAKLDQIVRDTLLPGGFEPFVSFTLATPRALICVVSIIYDRDIIGEDDRAMTVNRTLNERLLAAGFPPYRLGVQSMEFWDKHQKLKALSNLETSLDPKVLLSPGHYGLS